MNRQPMEYIWRKYLQMIWPTGLISKIYKQLIQLNNNHNHSKKQPNQKMGIRTK